MEYITVKNNIITAHKSGKEIEKKEDEVSSSFNGLIGDNINDFDSNWQKIKKEEEKVNENTNFNLNDIRNERNFLLSQTLRMIEKYQRQKALFRFSSKKRSFSRIQ